MACTMYPGIGGSPEVGKTRDSATLLAALAGNTGGVELGGPACRPAPVLPGPLLRGGL